MRVQDILRTKGAKLSAILPDASIREAAPSSLSLSALEHDPEKWTPVFGRRSCSNKNLKRDDDSKKSHPALMKLERNGSVGNRRCHFRLIVNAARHPAQRRSSRPRTGIISKSRLNQSMATTRKPQFETLEHINKIN
ncbi:MAG: hypothetical protein CR217_15850 [Beijerinckiaceae bacterium]|nr:MAG: hypothetical protein CR217_15850 [Beijerinckiaceae bacterium]